MAATASRKGPRRPSPQGGAEAPQEQMSTLSAPNQIPANVQTPAMAQQGGVFAPAANSPQSTLCREKRQPQLSTKPLIRHREERGIRHAADVTIACTTNRARREGERSRPFGMTAKRTADSTSTIRRRLGETPQLSERPQIYKASSRGAHIGAGRCRPLSVPSQIPAVGKAGKAAAAVSAVAAASAQPPRKVLHLHFTTMAGRASFGNTRPLATVPGLYPAGQHNAPSFAVAQREGMFALAASSPQKRSPFTRLQSNSGWREPYWLQGAKPPNRRVKQRRAYWYRRALAQQGRNGRLPAPGNMPAPGTHQRPRLPRATPPQGVSPPGKRIATEEHRTIAINRLKTATTKSAKLA